MRCTANPANPCITPAPSDFQSRNNRTGRLPTYRSTYMGRFHPYARFVSPKRRDKEQMVRLHAANRYTRGSCCLDAQYKIEDGLYEDEDSSWEMVAAPVRA